MTDTIEKVWGDEIRDFLLGRMSKNRAAVRLPGPHTTMLDHPPIRRWWIFEGKYYSSIGGTLARRLGEALRLARLMERTFNPRLKLSEHVDGSVDWGATLARGPAGPIPEYVLRSSGVGLGEEERNALRGWLGWIADQSGIYRDSWTFPGQQEDLDALWLTAEAMEVDGAPTIEQLRRWSHAARRSRWPLLRDLVAESFRTMLEPEVLDQVPLPTERARLFEILCLVRIAKCLPGIPKDLRWLDNEMGQNTLHLPGVTCRYQMNLPWENVRTTVFYAGGLSEAAEVFDLPARHAVDLLFEFDKPMNGLDGILIEAKSGGQGFSAAVEQLRIYRAAHQRRPGSRWVVWGIVEAPAGGPPTAGQVQWLETAVGKNGGDVWTFSGADYIPQIMATILG